MALASITEVIVTVERPVPRLGELDFALRSSEEGGKAASPNSQLSTPDRSMWSAHRHT